MSSWLDSGDAFLTEQYISNIVFFLGIKIYMVLFCHIILLFDFFVVLGWSPGPCAS
jgi:hypothetical protein